MIKFPDDETPPMSATSRLIIAIFVILMTIIGFIETFIGIPFLDKF